MLKKFFIMVAFFCMFFSVVGNSWAVCDFMESGRPRIRDLYQTDPSNDKNKQALICEKGKCEDGEIVFAKSEHYRAKDKQSGNVFYKCNRSGNNSWDVLSEGMSYLETISNVCGNSNAIGTQVFPVDNPNGTVIGVIRGNGVFVTDICVKPYDERCGVKCTPENGGKMFVCKDGGFYCNPETHRFETEAPIVVCDYSDPEKIKGNYKIWATTNIAASFSIWVLSEVQLENGFFTMDQACMGCSGGYYSSFSIDKAYECVNDKDEAWCNWRKNKESKNTEWKDGHCECLDKGKEWNTETHDCVKSGNGGKTSGKTGSSSGKTGSGTGKTSGGKTGSGSGKTGGSGSGKTGGGSSGNGKLGSGKADEKCGVKCNEKNWHVLVYCDKNLWHCDIEDLDAIPEQYRWDNEFYASLKECVYSDPTTRVIGKYKERIDLPVNEYNFAVFGTRVLKQGDVVSSGSEKDNFCFGCVDGYYGTNRVDCYSDLERAWCEFDDLKTAFHTKWNEKTRECKCTDNGMVWDNVSHKCIPDNGVRDDSGQGEKKITTKNCKININATVKCRNSRTFSGEVELELSAENCQEYQANSDKNLSEIAKLLCANLGGVDNILTDADVQDAKKRVDRFFEYAESNRNVWKNEEGKFNTARLASDATAGVILGTVGGIVSAHIIKKKQVEKGFDALKCAIGGQKVADWGDEFRVGFGVR